MLRFDVWHFHLPFYGRLPTLPIFLCPVARLASKTRGVFSPPQASLSCDYEPSDPLTASLRPILLKFSSIFNFTHKCSTSAASLVLITAARVPVPVFISGIGPAQAASIMLLSSSTLLLLAFRASISHYQI